MGGVYQYQCVSCQAILLGGKYDAICEDCRTGHSAELLDAFYGAVPEHFANAERTAGCAAGIPLNDTDRTWLRGIRKAMAFNHPLARMTRLDEKMGLYDDSASAIPSRRAETVKHGSAGTEGSAVAASQTPKGPSS